MAKSLGEDIIENRQLSILKYPNDLSTSRYVAFDFYAPEFSKEIVSSIVGIVDAGIELVTGDVGDAADKGVSALKVGGNALKTAFNNSKDRFKIVTDKDGNQSATGDIAQRGIEKSSNTYKGTVYLPLSNSLAESIANNYDENPSGAASLLEAIGGGTAMKALNQVSKFTGTRSLLINPDLTQNYTGNALRSFSLDWTLTPRNDKETKNILDIVKAFKEYSSPKLQAANALLLEPYFCVVTFNNEKLDDAIRMEEMIISNINIDYGGGMSNMEMFSDGMVKQLTLKIDLKERRMKTKEDWVKDNKTKVRTAGNIFDLTTFNNNLEFNTDL